MFVFLWQYNLMPCSLVRYERQALIGTEYDIGLRVTFDTQLSFQSRPLHPHDASSSLPVLPANLVVMEIKVNERIPLWLTEMISAHNLQMVRVSKYCRSVEAARSTALARWFMPMAESSEEVLATTASVFRRSEVAVENDRRSQTTNRDGGNTWTSSTFKT
jgi:hypothetical protein